MVRDPPIRRRDGRRIHSMRALARTLLWVSSQNHDADYPWSKSMTSDGKPFFYQKSSLYTQCFFGKNPQDGQIDSDMLQLALDRQFAVLKRPMVLDTAGLAQKYKQEYQTVEASQAGLVSYC